MAVDGRNDWAFSPADLTTISGYTSGANAINVSQAAGANTRQHVAKRINASLGVSGAQTPIAVIIVNGTTGQTASTALYLASFTLAPPASGVDRFDYDNLHIAGTSATAMTLYVGAPAAGSNVTAFLQTYDFPVAPKTFSYSA
jgi:hypothetical protein